MTFPFSEIKLTKDSIIAPTSISFTKLIIEFIRKTLRSYKNVITNTKSIKTFPTIPLIANNVIPIHIKNFSPIL